MKLVWIFILAGMFVANAKTFSQNVRLDLKIENASLKSVLSQIEEKTDYYFFYKNEELENLTSITVDAKQELLSELLDNILKNKGFEYKVHDHYILIQKANENSSFTDLIQQQKSVSGKVTDSSGSPLPGVSVVVKGTTIGSITDANGSYSVLNVPANATLQFSFVGMKSQEVKVGTQTSLNMILEEETIGLEEVVAIGYGTQKKSDVTGAVATVSGDKLAKIPTAGAAGALQGMAAGLSIDFNDGTPGKSPQMLVRGVTSWGSSNEPLVIIDGVPGDIKFLNPEDIKSITVLKDAANAAIYGSRSAAGVILIETFRGKNSKPKVTFSAYLGIDDLPKRMDVCNSAEYIKVNKLALTNAGISQDKWPKYISAYEKDPSQFDDTDWQKEYYRTGIAKKYNLGYTAGNEVLNVAFSGFYSANEGIIVGTDASKMGFRLNSDMTHGSFKIGESVNYGRSEDKPEEYSGFPGMWQTTNIQPLVSVYDANNEGGFGGAIPGMGMTDAANPVAFNELINTLKDADQINVSSYIQYKYKKDLVAKFQAGRSLDFFHSYSFTPTYVIGSYNINQKAKLTEGRDKMIKDLYEFTLNYDKTFQKHSLSGVAGLSQEEYQFRTLSATASTFENNDLGLLVHGQESFDVDGTNERSRLRSAFGRVSYNYDYKYMLMGSVRYDGSSKFGDGSKWGFFPSFSLGWNLSNESFWLPLKATVSSFKLRASYGVLGNQSIGTYKYIPEMSYDLNDLNYPFGNSQKINLGYAVTTLPSFSIQWESTLYKNLGFDAALWNNQLEFSFEVYQKYTSDMLSTKPISLATGVSTFPIVNDGELQTNGWEFQASYKNNSHQLKYRFDINLDHYKSVLKKMANEGFLYEIEPARTYVGGEIGEFWVYETQGIFRSQAEVTQWNTEHGFKNKSDVWVPLQSAAAPGDIRFVDQNGDGILDTKDKIKVGSGTPKVTVGINISLNYRDFDFVANLYGAFGQKRYNMMKRQLQRMDKHFNYGKDALNSWTPENVNSSIPRAVIGDPNNNNRASTRYIENGDYMRLNNVQLGYNLPKTYTRTLGIEALRVYAGGMRLLTFTNYKGYDPGMTGSIDSRGVDNALYPLSRTYILGLQLTF